MTKDDYLNLTWVWLGIMTIIIFYDIILTGGAGGFTFFDIFIFIPLIMLSYCYIKYLIYDSSIHR
jgi:hypothetical protein